MDENLKSQIRRGHILLVLKPLTEGLSDRLLLPYLNSLGHPITKTEVRLDLDYLAGTDKNFIEFLEKTTDLWRVKLAPKGVDLLEQRPPSVDGIIIAR